MPCTTCVATRTATVVISHRCRNSFNCFGIQEQCRSKSSTLNRKLPVSPTRLLHCELLKSGQKIRIPECEAAGEQFSRPNAAALNNQFGFRAHEECADFQKPSWGGQT